MTWLDTSLRILTLLIMLIGLFGLVIPIFPGVVVIWLAALGYGLIAGFGTLGGWLFAVITVLMLVGVTVDNVLMGAGARQGGASWIAVAVGVLAGILGTAAFPPVGGLIAAPLGLFAVEALRQRDWRKAFEASRGWAWGCGWAFIIRFGLGVVMIVLWGFWAWS